MILDADTPPAGTVRDWLDHRASTTGDALAYVFAEAGEASLTWSHLQSHAARLAAAMTASGIAKGESVAVMMPNGRDAVLATMAALYGGFRATMINLVAGSEAITFALSHSEARFAFVAADQSELFQAADPGGAINQLPIDLPAGDRRLHDLAPTDHALLMYTSGTTGRPKGVVHSHASLLAGGWTTAIAHALQPNDRGLCVLPIHHINGLCVTVMGALVSGGSLAMCRRFSTSSFWADAAKLQATWFSVVPTIISHLLHAPENPDAATKARLRFGRSASSPLSPEVQAAFEARFGVPVIETMGLTETAAQILSNPLPPGQRKVGSPGIAFGNEVAVVDADHLPVPPGVEGEIAVRGPTVMLEYLKNPDATAKALVDGGWLLTGDLGRQDGDGYVFVTGRLKELIIKGGENIAPREVDEALHAHPDVVEAAAFARPCETYGERGEAAVRLKPGSALTAADLVAICAERLGAFKSPDIVHLLDELPKGPSGKIQRLRLAEITGRADTA